MASLVITKGTIGQFSFVLDGDVANEVKNTRNDLTTVGIEAHFKTSNGANLIKNQQINPSDVTIIDGATTLNPTTVAQLFTMLDSVGYFDWIGLSGGGGGGVDRFDELLDTPDYFGNDGKTLIIDESQLKLIAVTFYNISKFVELLDVPNTIVPGKILIGNPAGDALIFGDIPPAPTDSTKLDSGGYPGTGQDLADADQNLQDQIDAIDLTGKEDTFNKVSTIVGNESSTVLYPNVLAVFNYFQQKLTDSIFGTFINALTSKVTPVDADSISIVDSADSNKAKKTTFANLKTFFKAYFDGFYALDANVIHTTLNETKTGQFTIRTTLNANQRIFINPDTGNIEGYNTSNSLAWRLQNAGASQGSFTLGTVSAYIYGRNGGPLELGASIAFIVPNATASNHAINKGQIDAILLSAVTAVLDFPSTATGANSDLTIAYVGAVLGDIVTLGVPFSSVVAGGNYTAFVSAADVVTVRFNNYSVASLNPASGTFKVKIIR